MQSTLQPVYVITNVIFIPSCLCGNHADYDTEDVNNP